MKRRSFLKLVATASVGVIFASSYVLRIPQFLYRKFINVRNYGAVGDGIANDIRAVRRAIDDLAEGGTLMFPAGTYLLRDTQCPLAISLRGEGRKGGHPCFFPPSLTNSS